MYPENRIQQIERDNCFDIWFTAVLCMASAFVFSLILGCSPVVIDPNRDKDPNWDRRDHRDDDHRDRDRKDDHKG